MNYLLMKEKPDALERLDLQFRWGGYGIRVLHWHLVAFEPGLLIRFHKHSEYEFHFIPRGKGTVTLIDQTFKLQGGMFYLTGPGVVHQQTADIKEGMDELCLHIDIVLLAPEAREAGWGEEHEAREADECMDMLHRFPLRPFLDQHDAMACFVTAYEAWRSGDIGSFTTIRQSLIEILLRAARAATDSSAGQLPERDIQAHRFQLALDYVHDNYAEPLTLSEVAEHVKVSSRQLQRILRKYGIDSFSAYVEDYRIRRICEDLIATAATVESIAQRHGYANTNYLYQVFKRKLGLTPLAYRDSNRQ